MKVSEVKKLIGHKVSVRRCYSGITDHGTILSVQGRNVEIDFHGIRDWFWLPDCIIKPFPEVTQ